jgi:lysozyme
MCLVLGRERKEMNIDFLTKQLIRQEGLRRKPYKDSVGKLTIGIGRNLDDVGLSNDECMYLLSNDIQRAYNALIEALPWVKDLDEVRQEVLANMCFNMGIGSLVGFKNTLAMIQAGDYTGASENMLKSKWASQVGQRAQELSLIMKTGLRTGE